jgi:shikimate 5-dehydrogenase
LLCARKPSSVGGFAARKNAGVVAWPPEISLARTMDIVINCTSVGTGPLSDYTPLAEISDDNESASVAWLDELPPTATVFDIIYDPAPSKLLNLARQQGFSTLDGGRMNLEQAVLAFDYAQSENPGLKTIHDIMASAVNNEAAK